MSESVTLFGYHYSVYARIAKMTCVEKGIAFTWSEVDPFADPPDPRLRGLNPFGRVPILEHGAFRLHETEAITRYLDEGFDGPPLQPRSARARARMSQIIGIVDAYAYWPMVRQVYAQAVFAPTEGRQPDMEAVAAGLRAAKPILDALEGLAGSEGILTGAPLSLADLHLAPMIAYFAMWPDAAELLSQRSALTDWWASMSARESLALTDPGLPERIV